MFSMACEYDIRATIYIAIQSHKDKHVGLKRIVKAIDLSEAFKVNLLQQLFKIATKHSIKRSRGKAPTRHLINSKLYEEDQKILKTSAIESLTIAFKEDYSF